ncbi:MAG TPA: hypothetical protein VEP30_04335 [Chthoniobacterales bacterium]|nr:hypothetical protein [Chthoniobacterales bacterium]
MKTFALSVLVLLLIINIRSNASAAPAKDEDVKILMRHYEQIEDQLARSVHYSKKEQSGDETTIQQAWFNGAGDSIKVATERTAPGRRELTEYIAADFELVHDGMFVLTREETAQPDGTTQVDESRKCLAGNGEIIRELKKTARFKPGESTDTVQVPNVAVDLKKLPKDKRSDQELLSKPQTIAESLQQSGQLDLDPFVNVTGDSEKYRVIRGTASPDGRYAIALGFTKGKIDWDKLADPDFPGTYSTDDSDGTDGVDSENGKTVNYVVDLTTRRILGTTGGDYFGTRHRYNHRECEVLWSPDSKNFVEIYSGKWNYESCHAGRISTGPKLVGTVDLGKYAEKAADSFRASHKHRKERGSIAIFASEVTNDGLIELELTDQESGGDGKGDVNFSADEKIRLSEASGHLRLDTVNVREAPQE